MSAKIIRTDIIPRKNATCEVCGGNGADRIVTIEIEANVTDTVHVHESCKKDLLRGYQ